MITPVLAAVGLKQPETPGGTHRSFWDIDDPNEIQVQPALLNKQDTTRFRLAEVAVKQFSSTLHINTVGKVFFVGWFFFQVFTTLLPQCKTCVLSPKPFK